MAEKVYDLVQRTFIFAMNCRMLLKNLPKTIQVFEDGKQLIRSSGSVGANYIEANESLSRKDFYYRIKICRKEAKESIYWLNLLSVCNPVFEGQLAVLVQEATELKKIFSSILEKSAMSGS
jgi:four helix bundle protein